MQSLLENLFMVCEKAGGSDIHIATGIVPRMRVCGELKPIDGVTEINEAGVSGIAAALGAADAQYSYDGSATSLSGSRYRYNVFRENGQRAIALRRLDDRFRTLVELGLPEGLADFCGCRDGLVIVTGPTGSGKSTTLATLIDKINQTRDGHIITIEDPIEYVHKSCRCLVNQRQIGRDASSFNSALVEAMRQDPDVILVGEIRDVETIRTAITAAETGHLVFTTLHAGDCAGAVERIVSVFPAGEQDGIRRQLAFALRGIFAQHLLPTLSGGRAPIYELLTATPAVANLVATGRSQQIYSVMEAGISHGMLTLDQSLAHLFTQGKISEHTAVTLSKNPDIMRDRVRASHSGGR